MIFGTEWGNPANPTQQRIEKRNKRLFFSPGRALSLASFLRSYTTEHHMFRAIAISVLLTLAVGPNAALLCKASCDQQVADAIACHHENTPAASSVTGPEVARSMYAWVQ